MLSCKTIITIREDFPGYGLILKTHHNEVIFPLPHRFTCIPSYRCRNEVWLIFSCIILATIFLVAHVIATRALIAICSMVLLPINFKKILPPFCSKLRPWYNCFNFLISTKPSRKVDNPSTIITWPLQKINNVSIGKESTRICIFSYYIWSNNTYQKIPIIIRDSYFHIMGTIRNSGWTTRTGDTNCCA